VVDVSDDGDVADMFHVRFGAFLLDLHLHLHPPGLWDRPKVEGMKMELQRCGKKGADYGGDPGHRQPEEASRFQETI
jgi:hypothetical protein